MDRSYSFKESGDVAQKKCLLWTPQSESKRGRLRIEQFGEGQRRKIRADLTWNEIRKVALRKDVETNLFLSYSFLKQPKLTKVHGLT